MFEGITHELTGSDSVLSRTVSAYLAEGVVAQRLGALQDQYSDADTGSYPFYRTHRFGTSIVLRSTDKAQLDQPAEAYMQIVRKLGKEPKTRNTEGRCNKSNWLYACPIPSICVYWAITQTMLTLKSRIHCYPPSKPSLP